MNLFQKEFLQKLRYGESRIGVNNIGQENLNSIIIFQTKSSNETGADGGLLILRGQREMMRLLFFMQVVEWEIHNLFKDKIEH